MAQDITLPESWIWTTLEGVAAKDKNAIVDGPFGSNLKVSDYLCILLKLKYIPNFQKLF
jgi:type I restriction enzyme S subunit